MGANVSVRDRIRVYVASHHRPGAIERVAHLAILPNGRSDRPVRLPFHDLDEPRDLLVVLLGRSKASMIGLARLGRRGIG